MPMRPSFGFWTAALFGLVATACSKNPVAPQPVATAETLTIRGLEGHGTFLARGEGVQLSAHVTTSAQSRECSPVAWSIDNTRVAELSSSGFLRAVADTDGDAIVTARCGTATARVTIAVRWVRVR